MRPITHDSICYACISAITGALYALQWDYPVGGTLLMAFVTAIGVLCVAKIITAIESHTATWIKCGAATAPGFSVVAWHRLRIGRLDLDAMHSAIIAVCLVYLIAAIRTACTRHVLMDNACAHCGYSLVGLTSEVCPECGVTFKGGDRYERLEWRL